MITDNTEVIRTLEARIAELEAELAEEIFVSDTHEKRIAELENALEAKRMVNAVRLRELEAENQRLREAAQAVVDSATPHYDRWVNGVTRICINRLAALLGGGGGGMIECGWWCPYCASAVPGDHVTYNRRHDYKSGGCGGRVHETSTPITDNTAVIKRLEARIAELEAENARLRDPDWLTYVTLTRIWLENYPPDIFTGVSGDPGPLFVVALRNALDALLGVRDE